MWISALLLVLGLLMTGTTALSAQGAPPLSVGARVRVTAPGLFANRKAVGVVAAQRGDTLVLRDVRNADETATRLVPLQAVERLEISRGRRPRTARALRGLGIGLLVGGAVGATIGALTDLRDDAGDDLNRAAQAGILGLIGGVAGAVVGAVVGATAPGESWERVQLPARVSVMSRDGLPLRLGVSVAF